MFSTLKQRLLLGVYIFLILSTPIGAYLVSQQQNLTSKAFQPKKTKVTEATPSSTISAKEELQKLSEQLNPLPKPSPTPASPLFTATSIGPTLSLKVILEGRAEDSHSGRLFVGILEGILTSNPKFLLNFTVDVPASGEFSNLSLAGLSPGSNYTALLKGSAQIATSSAFLMSSTVTSLSGGKPLIMLSGDLNDDNSIDSADYSIAKKALGSTAGAANWNENADLNKDGVVNTLDLAIITKNLGKTGASGSWTSPLPKTATPSGALIPSATDSDTQAVGGGYWIWVPK